MSKELTQQGLTAIIAVLVTWLFMLWVASISGQHWVGIFYSFVALISIFYIRRV